MLDPQDMVEAATDSIPYSPLKGREQGIETNEHEFIWADLLDADFPPVQWIANGLIPQGVFTVIIGPPFVGKSTTVRNGSVAILTDQTWLGRETKKVPVIYATFEGSKASIRDHFTLMDLPREAPLLVYRGPKLDRPFAWLESRINMMKERTGCETGVAFVDTLLKFIPPVKDGSYETMSPALQPILDLAEATGWAIVGIHHSGKGRTFSKGEESLGSQAITGAADQIISIGWKDEKVWFYTMSRDGEQSDLTEIVFDRETKWSSAGKTEGEVAGEDLEQELLRFIEESETKEAEWSKLSDIKKGVKGQHQRIEDTLSKMVENGLLDLEGAGVRGNPKRYRIRRLV